MAADRRNARLGVLGLVALLLFGAIGSRVWFLQVIDAESLQQRVEVSARRTVTLLPERGRIFDVDGRIVADNSRVLVVTLDRSIVPSNCDKTSGGERAKQKRYAEFWNLLSGPLNTPTDDLEARFCSKLYVPQEPVPLKEDVREDEALYLLERRELYRGIEVTETWRREYPYAPLASHVIGYMGSIPADDPSTTNINETKAYTDKGYLLSERVGASGVEKSYEDTLRGKPGKRVYEVDSAGRVLRTLEDVPPTNGYDIQLTIDLDIQQFAEQALQSELAFRRTQEAKQSKAEIEDHGVRTYSAPAGSVVVENHDTGAIVAMASYPTFDNRWFGAKLPPGKFSELFPADVKPDQAALVNRAIQGQYNVGSSFKPFTAYSALQSGLLPGGINYTFDDTGTYKIIACQKDKSRELTQKCVFRNAWNSVLNVPTYYGTIGISEALGVSSDTFFYKIGDEFLELTGGQPVFQNELRQFGFGQKTGIDLPYERPGILPDKQVMDDLRRRKIINPDEGFSSGQSILLAVGQGVLAVSPLQLVNAYAVFANGGNRLQPEVVAAIFEPGTPDAAEAGFAELALAVVHEIRQPKVVQTLDMNPNLRDPILNGLKAVVRPLVIGGHATTAGKVFTYFPMDDVPLAGKTGTAQGAGNLSENDSSVFVAFSTSPSLPYTVGAYLEKSGYGKLAAAPVVKCMFYALSGRYPALQPVRQSDPLDISARKAAPDQVIPDNFCLRTNEPVVTYADRG
jgi:penicillin-binding protein 2